MPEAAMRADAGTDVVVDILFFQKRATPRRFVDDAIQDESFHGGFEPSWIEVAPSGLEIDGKPVMVNKWFLAHPNTVLGEHAVTTGQYGPTYTCKHKGGDLDLLLLGAIAALPSGIYEPASLDRSDQGRLLLR
jgi:hypothetical protein